MKQIVSKNEYLQLVGLKTIAVQYNKKLQEIYESVNELMEEEDDEGWISDFIYDENTSVDKFLEGLKVEKI